MTDTVSKTTRRVARELGIALDRVQAALSLFQDGATLPFIARYRKERTGGLDEIQLREIRDRTAYLTELEDRRAFVLESIREQDALDSDLEEQIRKAETKQVLEDLYLPFRPRRRTRATTAIEQGLGPLADGIWSGRLDDAGAVEEARRLVEGSKAKGTTETGPTVKALASIEAALNGARDILAERVAEDHRIRGYVRERCRKKGQLYSRALRGRKKLPEAQRFRDYFEHSEPMNRVQTHRVLAIRRGESEGILAWGIEPPDELREWVRARVLERGPARTQLEAVAEDAWKRVLHPAVESELKSELKDEADREAIRVFGTNLENLLLQPPAGERPVLGLDPGFRTGVKAAMVSRTGAVQATAVLYLHREEEFARHVADLTERYNPDLIAVGNGTGSRETEAAVRGALKAFAKDGAGGTPPGIVSVNEAGASVYSASELAGRELPDLDVSLRGAVSIARRLQDPLAELVKIDPRSIGVGQYQHDVNQTQLAGRLDEVVETCVNRVGVEVNTASAALLAYVAGIGPRLAENIVTLRDRKNGFATRKELLEVPLLGPRAFEQAAGFLRIRGGPDPLDCTAVHPERYALVRQMARDQGTDIAGLLENTRLLDRMEGNLSAYVTEEAGLPTLEDIMAELRRPGRDPRDSFEAPAFRDDVQTPEDLEVGMVLQGVVTNVVAFGAFVDIGVHQDGLVHISQLADRFVKDPNEVVAVGRKVRVKVVSLELDRGRIGLSMKEVGASGSATRAG